MSKMGEYAMERAIAEAKNKPRIRTKKPGNVPAALCEQRADAHIAGCIKEGLDIATATANVLAWNAIQPSPMKVSGLTQRIYLAYRASGVGSV